jgi:hypothetical protein
MTAQRRSSFAHVPMTTTVAGLLARVAVLIAAGTSGAYVLIGLYRWEWHRALVAGVFFLASELALMGLSLGNRLSRLERNVRRLGEDVRAGDLSAAPPYRDAATGPDLPWLDVVAHGRERHVFVPILLGSGAIISALAYLIERASASTAGAVSRTGDLPGFEALVPPAHLIGDAPTAVPPHTNGRHHAAMIGGLVALAVGATGILVLREQTMSVVEQTVPGSAVVVDVDVRSRRWDTPTEQLGATLWAECSSRLGAPFSLEAMTVLDAGSVRYTIVPEPPTLEERRFTGCLQDALLDDVLADVQSWTPVSR